MRLIMLAACIGVLSVPAWGIDADEARIEAALHGQTVAAAKPKPAPGKNAKDADALLVGAAVRVHTLEHGLYIGTLDALSRDTVSLKIVLPHRQLSYSLPRAMVARIEPL